MKILKYYDLRKTNDAPRWGWVYYKRFKNVPGNLDVFIGNHLFAFWGWR